MPTRWLIAGEWRAHPVRMGLAVLAIAVGVALGFAVHMVNSAALASFGRAVASVQGRADVAVRARSAAGLDEGLYPKLARLPAVQAISPVVELTASWGKLARPGSSAKGGRFTLIGLDPLRAMSVTPGLVGLSRAGQSGVGSRPAWQGDAVWLSPALQRATGLQPGDAFTFTAAGRQARFTVMGRLAAAGDDAQIAVIDISEAQWRFGQMGRLHRLDLKLADGAGARAAVQAVLPADAVLATPEAEASRADALSRAYRVNLGMLALVALLTGGFLVWSAQALSVARRRPQFALLSVLGLPRAGLVRQLLSEGLLLGVAGAVIGVALGYGLATLVVEQFGGDLGGGYFSRTQARLGFDLPAALLFGGLGLATALAGSISPALAAARTAPAQALKGLGDAPDPAKAPRAWPSLALLAAGGLAALGPPVFGLPLLGYAAMALLLAGGVALMPALARLLLTPLARGGSAWLPLDLAVRRLWGVPQAAGLALSGIVASTALMVAMAVMVASFRQSVDDWLVAVLPSDLYLHLEGAEAGGLAPADQARLAAVPGMAHVRFQRVISVRIDPARPAVAVMAQGGHASVPLIAETDAAAPAGTTRALISEPLAWLYGWRQGEVHELVIGGVPRRLFVAGTWRDYARQWGAIVVPIEDYRRFTGDATATEAAFDLNPGADARAVQDALQQALPVAVQGQAQFGRPAEMRAVALTIFDRSFAVTYALEAIAIIIGLIGVATSFSAQVLARMREFGMLRHVGVPRRQILQMLGLEGAGLGLIGALSGLSLGLVMALVLVRVVNPQSFHWTMDLALPWPLLAGLVAALVACAGGTAVVAGRRALGKRALLAVRADW
ncbi:FtsX-like permease family protein [Sandarakinorhabdus limnophila]|uniref:FtsX-like permease family protein n=1 Tax=Sandarakinorhabdus limnophila TaxID=210512 RepID=UPI0026F25F7F|nr:ABC transporter permease [Sandarakinorhabdus limnophila]MCM0033128.1 ABC transporter permease [Sandarakinorhabdus limnophila]